MIVEIIKVEFMLHKVPCATSGGNNGLPPLSETISKKEDEIPYFQKLALGHATSLIKSTFTNLQVL